MMDQQSARGVGPTEPDTRARVLAVCRSATHTFSKTPVDAIELLAELGVAGDAHAGRTVRLRSRVAVDPSQPNLRQVHLIHAELLDELCAQEFRVALGTMGENITMRGIDLLSPPRGTGLNIASARVAVTGLRNPCRQLDDYQQGLTQAVLDRDPQGNLIRKAGVMGTVLAGGWVRPGDPVAIVLPPEPHLRLERV
jgi:MOSC domain-containing protein YiiM